MCRGSLEGPMLSYKPYSTLIQKTRASHSVFVATFHEGLDAHPNLKLLPDDCGERIVLFKNVSDKNDIFRNQFPFVAALQVREENPYPVCVGTLINEKYVLTTAFCAKNNGDNPINVRLGEYNFETEVDCDEDKYDKSGPNCNDPVQDISIESITVHEEYEYKFKNDIALVRLAHPANLTRNNVRTICLPMTSELRDRNYGKGQIAGFSNYRGNALHILKRSFVHVISDKEKCENYYFRDNTYSKLLEKYICGHIDKIVGSAGQGGAPLFQLGKLKVGERDKYLQFGIFISGANDGDAYKINEAGGILLINVIKYMKWILDNIKP